MMEVKAYLDDYLLYQTFVIISFLNDDNKLSSHNFT
jgi:hypothetical protein